MQISKKKTYKILAYCAMSAILLNGGVASAEDDSTNTTSTAQNTTTNVDDSNYSGGNIPATPKDEDDSNNTLTVSNITTTAGEINAGWSKYGITSNNILNIRNVNAPRAIFHSGYSSYPGSNGIATNNIINFFSGTAGEIHGAHTVNGDATYNTVNFIDGTVVQDVGAAYSEYGNVNYNTLNISGGVINRDAYGGKTNYGGADGSGNASNNVVNINGGTINGTVYGGWAPGGYARNNEINIYGNPNLSNATLYAGMGKSADAVSGNNLNIYTQGLNIQNIGGFENLNFYLPTDIANGATIINLLSPDPSNPISNNINVFNPGYNTLTTGDTINLITTSNPNGFVLGQYSNDGTFSKGISLEYALNLSPVTNANGNVTGLTATVGELRGGTLTPQTELLTSAVVDSASSLDSGTDRLLEWLPPEGIADINSMPATYFDPFLGIGGSSLKINTGNGTKLKTKNGGINFGLSSYLPNSHGMLIIAPVADYGQDYYESTLPDANGTTGHGHTKYFTAGFIARQVSTHGMYYETSLRYGQVRTNFLSNNFLVHNVPTTASYSASTPCYSGHVRIGWRNNISPQNILDVYGVYSLNRVNGFTTTVTSGEDYAFSAVKSGRIRLGVRLTREVKEKHSFYSGLSYIHEFTGDTVGEYMGMTTKRAGLKGNTGLIELGYQMKPSKNSVTMLDAGLTWWFGDQKGVTFAAKFKRDF